MGKGVTLADVEPEFGETVLAEIEKEFGPNKAIFVKTDVTDIQQFEEAFKKTIEKYKHVDILFNNAGILNDALWEKQIAVNVNGTIHGMLLGFDNYLQKYKQGSEAVIVNISSVTGLSAIGSVPIYCGTKAAIIAMTRTWGIKYHYERSKVKVICICPGLTGTPLIFDMSGRNLGAPYEKWTFIHGEKIIQTPEYLAKEVINVISHSQNGTIWVVEADQPAYEYILPERETMKKLKH